MRLCSQLRSLERTRNLPILIIVEPHDNARLLRGLDMGVNDYLMRPVDKNELLARVYTQLKRRRYTERLRDNVQQSIEMAVTDPLTGLYNRRYMETHLDTLIEQAANRGKAISILVIDIDYFKVVNDSHGHGIGDQVLQEFATGSVQHSRHRYGLPGRRRGIRSGHAGYRHGAGLQDRRTSAADHCRGTRSTLSPARPLDITISIGICAFTGRGHSDEMLKRADQALYRAKRDGRNRVVADAA